MKWISCRTALPKDRRAYHAFDSKVGACILKHDLKDGWMIIIPKGKANHAVYLGLDFEIKNNIQWLSDEAN